MVGIRPETAVPPAVDQQRKDFESIRSSPAFRKLRKKYRSFAFPVVILALAWYATFILLSAYAPAFMSIRIADNITVGLVLGLLQIVSTFAVTLLYVWYANRVLDPMAADLRTTVELRLGVSTEGTDQ